MLFRISQFNASVDKLAKVATLAGRVLRSKIFCSDHHKELAMAKDKAGSVEDLLRDMMIVQLFLAGIGQREIREIAGVDIARVSRIGKLLKKRKAR